MSKVPTLQVRWRIETCTESGCKWPWSGVRIWHPTREEAVALEEKHARFHRRSGQAPEGEPRVCMKCTVLKPADDFRWLRDRANRRRECRICERDARYEREKYWSSLGLNRGVSVPATVGPRPSRHSSR